MNSCRIKYIGNNCISRTKKFPYAKTYQTTTQPVDSIFTTNQIIDIIYIMCLTLDESSCKSCDFQIVEQSGCKTEIVNELLKIAVREKEHKTQKGKGKDGGRKAGVRKYGTHTHGQERHQK